jgi:twitching motility protein PilU
MMVTPTISRLIRENKISEIQNFINDGESVGMLSFKQSLLNLIESDMITPETGYQFADSKDEFDLALRGIRSKFK